MLRHPGPSASGARDEWQGMDAAWRPIRPGPRAPGIGWGSVTRPARSRARAPSRRRERLLGGVFAFCAYFLWGFLPLYFLTLRPTGPWEIVAWRIVFSLLFCIVLLAVLRSWRRFGDIIRQ